MTDQKKFVKGESENSMSEKKVSNEAVNEKVEKKVEATEKKVAPTDKITEHKVSHEKSEQKSAEKNVETSEKKNIVSTDEARKEKRFGEKRHSDKSKADFLEKTFVDSVVSVGRVTKVTKGGKRFAFSAFVVSGDQNGNVGIGLGKSREVSSAITKATNSARKNLIKVSLRGDTLPYEVFGKHGATQVIIRPACKGTGLIAGGAVRAVMTALGVKNVLSKTIGSSRCGANVVKATLNALAKCRSIEDLAKMRNLSFEEVVKGSHYKPVKKEV